MNSKNGKMNGKKLPLRNLLKNTKTEVITATEGDFFYIRVPLDSTASEVERALEQLQRIFPQNFVFIIPETLTIKQLHDKDLANLGLMRIPKVKHDPTCPKCKSKKTMNKYNSIQYKRVCLEVSCGFEGGWRPRTELDEGDQKSISKP